MISWTGYDGEKDTELRASGKVFHVFLMMPRPGVKEEVKVVVPPEDLDRFIDEEHWDLWVNVAAPDAKTAVDNFDRAISQFAEFRETHGDVDA